MRFHISCQIFLGVFLFLQLGNGEDSEKIFTLQKKAEQLIEKVLLIVRDYYDQIKSDFKCIPDEIPDKIMEILKSSIDCVDDNEKKFELGGMTKKIHQKNFLKCFSKAKKEVKETMQNIDPTRDYCPENMTEKTYQINVTTSYTKTFSINIKNGLEISRKEIQANGNVIPCGKKEIGANDDEDDTDDADANGDNINIANNNSNLNIGKENAENDQTPVPRDDSEDEDYDEYAYKNILSGKKDDAESNGQNNKENYHDDDNDSNDSIDDNDNNDKKSDENDENDNVRDDDMDSEDDENIKVFGKKKHKGKSELKTMTNVNDENGHELDATHLENSELLYQKVTSTV